MIAALLALRLAAPAGAADVYIGVQGAARGDRPKLALPQFSVGGPDDSMLASRVREVLRSDLLFSRYFELVTDGPPVAGLTEPQIEDAWSKLAAVAVLGSAPPSAGKGLDLKLLDLNSRSTLAEKVIPPERWRAAAHEFSDAIVAALLGRPGIAHTRLAFANDKTGSKEIYVADYDGAGLRRITTDRSIALLPRWSHDGRDVYYTDYKAHNPDIYDTAVDGGATRLVSSRSGLNIAGGFSPDGKYLLVTFTHRSATNIYRLTVGDHRAEQVTFHWGIDASPTYSPDGRQIAFVSDRAGNPEIYVMEIETARNRRLTDLNWCDSPSWSPSGDWIAFSGRVEAKARLNIYLVDLTGNQLRQLTRDAGDNEDPTWSPDGRFLAFTTTRSGRREVYLMDADGSAPHRLVDAPGDSFTPNWGP